MKAPRQKRTSPIVIFVLGFVVAVIAVYFGFPWDIPERIRRGVNRLRGVNETSAGPRQPTLYEISAGQIRSAQPTAQDGEQAHRRMSEALAMINQPGQQEQGFAILRELTDGIFSKSPAILAIIARAAANADGTSMHSDPALAIRASSRAVLLSNYREVNALLAQAHAYAAAGDAKLAQEALDRAMAVPATQSDPPRDKERLAILKRIAAGGGNGPAGNAGARAGT